MRPMTRPRTRPANPRIDEFAELARHIHVSNDFDESLARITSTARHSIGRCEAASISLIHKDGPVARAQPAGSHSTVTRSSTRRT